MPRRKKSDVEKVMEKHNQNLMEITLEMIRSRARPTIFNESLLKLPAAPKKLTKKQRTALAKGREILASKRSKQLLRGGR